MPLEDYTTYTEVDDDGCITVVGPYEIQAVGLPRANNNFVVADKSAEHFEGDFEHLLQTKVTAGDHGLSMGFVWGVSDTVDDYGGWVEGETFHWYWDPYGNGPQFRLNSKGGVSVDSIPLLVNTDYWLRVTRVGTDVTVYVYSDAEREVLVDDFSVVAAGGAIPYRYIYAVCNWDTGQVWRTIDFEVCELDLKEAMATPMIRSQGRQTFGGLRG